MEAELINLPLLKNLIKSEIERNVTENFTSISDKLKKLENECLHSTVEIYGIHDNRLSDKKIRYQYVKKICLLLQLDFKTIVSLEYKKNYICLKLTDAATAREWQTRSCQRRLKNYDLGIDFDGPIKIFVAASHEHKQLLKRTRDLLLPHYKYVSLCRAGVMVRQTDTSRICIVKSETDIYDLLRRAKTALDAGQDVPPTTAGANATVQPLLPVKWL